MTQLAHTPSTEEHYRPADHDTQKEVGGILERAFLREDGQEPYEDEMVRFFGSAQEADERAEQAEAAYREAQREGELAAERYALTAGPDDLAAMERFREQAEAYRREAETLREEAERLRKYIPG